MLINSNTVLLGKKVVLVPYKDLHVDCYHKWMQDEEILRLTASEKLSIKEEYEMQMKWAVDSDKLTFILLNNDVLNRNYSKTNGEKEIDAMIGDVNIFLNNDCAELEVMVAVKSARGKGIGFEALKIMMSYAVENIKPLNKFIAKVGTNNSPSLNLFQDKLRFKELSRSQVFNEITLFKDVSDLKEETKYKTAQYTEWRETK